MENCTRRTFVAAGIAACGTIAAMPAFAEEAPASATAPTEETVVADEELDCDVLIIGAGGSGLAACVEAGDRGLKTICIESQPAVGGNENMVEGCFAVESSLQKAEGLVFDTGAIVRRELEQGQYRSNGALFIDMIDASGENIDWLLEHGVKFWRVDADHGTERFFHRYEETAGAVGYIPPMLAAAEAAGVEVLLETHGDSLIVEDGVVKGAYATKSDSTVLKINAKGVIIATGGFADDDELMAQAGYDPSRLGHMAFPGHDGAGHRMAVKAGASSYLPYAAAVADVSMPGLPLFFNGGKFNPYFFSKYPRTIWVDDSGSRFLNEDFALENMMLPLVPTLWRGPIFALVDSAIMDDWTIGDATLSVPEMNDGIDRGGTDALTELADGIELGVIMKGDTLEDVAAQAGIDPDALKATVERYNASVEAGSDREFGKDAQYLAPISQPPFYLCRPQANICAPVGSIRTDRHFRAVTDAGDPIQGLYVVGVEGAMLWSNVYTVNISGGCNANNVNSGRKAVAHIAENLL